MSPQWVFRRGCGGALALHLGIEDRKTLHRIYRSIYDEAPPRDASLRFEAVLAGSAS